MDRYLTKARGGKKGQIRPMIRFCVPSAARVTTGRVDFNRQQIFLTPLFWTVSEYPTNRDLMQETR